MPQIAQFRRLNRRFEPVGAPIRVKFNPTEFTLAKNAQVAEIAIPGLDAPILQFVRGQSETLALELFFDTTDDGTGVDAKPVTELTDEFYKLIKIDRETHAIPICRFEWGVGEFPGSHMQGQWASQNVSRVSGFVCIVDQVRQRFTMFNPNGVPIRATLSVQLREYKTLEQQITQLNLLSPDHTRVHVVQRGDTLSRIADDVYGDPRQWRPIADHNRLDNPLALTPGMVLEIPPTR
ncbi:MAG: LysM peptidoglycan-binding domain-containing protein [Chloroflexi bacterium]|nr:LysM peptidoglycan-binding domain-containing protein [Chloroflexota bacterium]